MFEDLCILHILTLNEYYDRVYLVYQNTSHCMNMYREREHRIAVGTMAGVFQKTAEQDVLKDLTTSYFTDELHSFVAAFKHLTKEEVINLEDNIMKKLTVSCAIFHYDAMYFMHAHFIYIR